MATYGYKCKLMVGSTELKIVGDVTINDSRTAIDLTSRASGGFKSTGGGIRAISIEFDLKHIPTNAGFVAIRKAYVENTPIHIKSQDGTSESDGAIDHDFTILEFPQAEPLDGVLTHAIKAELFMADESAGA